MNTVIGGKATIGAAVLAVVATVSCAGNSDGNNPVGASRDGQLAISSTSRGFQSIEVSVDGAVIGTLRQTSTDTSSLSNCTAVSGQRVVATLPVGTHSYSARANTGNTWNNTVEITAGGCIERNLTCTNGDCGGGSGDGRVLQPLGNWGTFTTSAVSGGNPVLRIGVRDHECEDGDILRVAVNGTTVLERELFNREYTQDFRFRPGANTITVTAVNGTGFKGACAHSNVNTGEISVTALSAQMQPTTSRKQTWQLEAGAGTSSNITVNLQ